MMTLCSRSSEATFELDILYTCSVPIVWIYGEDLVCITIDTYLYINYTFAVIRHYITHASHCTFGV